MKKTTLRKNIMTEPVTLSETIEYSVSMPYENYVMLKKFNDKMREYDCTMFAQFVDASRGLGYIVDDMKNDVNAEKCRRNPFMQRMVISNEDLTLDGFIGIIETMKVEMSELYKEFSKVVNMDNSIERHYQENIILPESRYLELTGYKKYYDKVLERLEWLREKIELDRRTSTWLKKTVESHMTLLMGLCMFVKDYARQCGDISDKKEDNTKKTGNMVPYKEAFADVPEVDKLLVSMYGGRSRMYGDDY